ncbi:unnamed protein product [Laminaria digitata]
MVVLTKGYRVVPQSLQGGTGFRHVHLKEHRGVFKATRSSEGDDSSQEAVVAKGRTLFVGNVDDQGGRLCRKTIEKRLRRALSQCGDIVHVQASSEATRPATTAGSTSAGPAGSGAGESKKGMAAGNARFAHVCFSSTKGVQQALALEELPSGVLEEDKQQPLSAARGDDAEEGEEGEEGGGANSGGGGGGEAPGDENRDENGDETCGYAALIQRHRRSFPPRQALQAEVDFTLQGFEKEEAAEIAGRKAMLESPEDDDGFITVTYKRKRGRNSGNPAESGVAGGGGAGGDKKKRKGAGELTDFYRFQMRESRREQLATLRSKFEQDKARVAKMKEQRKFRPF